MKTDLWHIVSEFFHYNLFDIKCQHKKNTKNFRIVYCSSNVALNLEFGLNTTVVRGIEKFNLTKVLFAVSYFLEPKSRSGFHEDINASLNYIGVHHLYLLGMLLNVFYVLLSCRKLMVLNLSWPSLLRLQIPYIIKAAKQRSVLAKCRQEKLI